MISEKEKETHPLNMFIGRDAIHAWASHLKMKVDHIIDGTADCIPLSQPVVFESGRTMHGNGSFGQSVCVLSFE